MKSTSPAASACTNNDDEPDSDDSCPDFVSLPPTSESESDSSSDSEEEEKQAEAVTKTKSKPKRKRAVLASAAASACTNNDDESDSDSDSCPDLVPVPDEYSSGDSSSSEESGDDSDDSDYKPESVKQKRKSVASARNGNRRGTNKRKSRRGKRTKASTNRSKRSKKRGEKKRGKHFAVWRRSVKRVVPIPRDLPEHTWRERAPPRTTCSTPWSTFRKCFLTDELLQFAVEEFNHYPKFLAAQRTRPPFVPKNQQWPPKWVSQDGARGPMYLTVKEYLKFLAILYLLGVKKLSDCNLDDLFSNDPVLREPWLCRITTRNDLGRFLRQVGA